MTREVPLQLSHEQHEQLANDLAKLRKEKPMANVTQLVVEAVHNAATATEEREAA